MKKRIDALSFDVVTIVPIFVCPKDYVTPPTIATYSNDVICSEKLQNFDLPYTSSVKSQYLFRKSI